jgi:DNA-binding transcriptional ArsR family regulator
MLRGKPRGVAASHLPVLVDTRLVKGLSHVLRQHILLAAVQGEVSPNELSKTLGEGLSQVSYHVKVLRDDCEMIERTRTVPRRGAIENYYRASVKTLFPAKAWRRLRAGLRTVVGAGQASDLFDDLAEALRAGKLQGTHDHITRTPLVLDAEGQRKVATIAQRATREVESEQRRSANRMAKANGGGGEVVAYTFALLAFEAAWEPADLHAPVRHDERAGATPANDAERNGGGSEGAGRGRERRAVTAAE